MVFWVSDPLPGSCDFFDPKGGASKLSPELAGWKWPGGFSEEDDFSRHSETHVCGLTPLQPHSLLNL